MLDITKDLSTKRSEKESSKSDIREDIRVLACNSKNWNFRFFETSSEEFRECLELHSQEIQQGLPEEKRDDFAIFVTESIKKSFKIQELEKTFNAIEPFESCRFDCLPSFKPEWIISTVFRQYTIELAEELQVSVDMVAGVILGIVSLSVQKKFCINPKPGWFEPINLYEIIIADPSERKSPVLKAARTPVDEYEREENERRKPEIERAKARIKVLNGRERGINKALENPKRGAGKKDGEESEKSAIKTDKDYQLELEEIAAEIEKLEKVHELTLTVDDATPEVMVAIMEANNERLGVMSAEDGLLDIVAGLYNGGKARTGLLTKSYTVERYQYARVSAGKKNITLYHPSISMVLLIQKSVLENITNNKDFTGRGLMARPLYIMPRSKIGGRAYETKAVSEVTKDNYVSAVKQLFEIPLPEKPEILKLSKRAYEVSKKFYEEIEKGFEDVADDARTWKGKQYGNTMRLAGNLHLMELAEKWQRIGKSPFDGIDSVSDSINNWMPDNAELQIEERTMQAAIEMSKYFEEHAKAAFSLNDLTDREEVRNAKYILKHLFSLSKDGETKITKRDLKRKCKKITQGGTMEVGLIELERRNYIRIEKEKPEVGRSSEVVIINPAIRKQKIF